MLLRGHFIGGDPLIEEDCPPPMGESLLFSLFPQGHFIEVSPIKAAIWLCSHSSLC